MRRVHIIIIGKVQGVHFRSNTKKFADSINLKGYVKNLANGTVEVEAEGSVEQINMLIDFCRVGEGMAKVENLEVSMIDHKNEFKDFQIRL